MVTLSLNTGESFSSELVLSEFAGPAIKQDDNVISMFRDAEVRCLHSLIFASLHKRAGYKLASIVRVN